MPQPGDERKRPTRTWTAKFGDAFRGLAHGLRGQSSFRVHLPLALLVLLAAAALGLDAVRWAVLLLCVTLVLTAELFNSALELLAKAVTSRQDPHIGAALDLAAAAVLVASAGSAVIGAIVFLSRIVELIG